jgi:hypothetical protein
VSTSVDGEVPRPRPGADPAVSGGILEGLFESLSSAREVLVAFLDLLSLEARRAGTTLAWMVACGALAALLLASAWLGLMITLALYAVSLDVPAPAAAAAVTLANLVAAVFVALACTRMSCDLLFRTTRRQLESEPARSPRP